MYHLNTISMEEFWLARKQMKKCIMSKQKRDVSTFVELY